MGTQRVIGMLGGMSWESTAIYYRLINEMVREKLGGLHSAKILLASVDFAEIEEFQREGDWDGAGARLAELAAGLESAGADLLLICANTMHKVAPAIEAAIGIPVLHVTDATAAAVRAQCIDTVGLLGTAFTMEQAFYRERLEAAGLTVLTPEANDRVEIHRVIYAELCQGIVSDPSREFYRRVMQRLAERGAQGMILGCTELELLITDADSPVPVFPTTQIHAKAAVQAISE